MSEPEQYSIEWFRWIATNNPTWMGTQAMRLWEHYLALEAKLEAAEKQALEVYGAGQQIEEARLALEAKLEAMGAKQRDATDIMRVIQKAGRVSERTYGRIVDWMTTYEAAAQKE